MEQFEKVEKGLEICTESTEYGGCITCPYHEDYYPNACRHVNKKDALALIRQQAEKIHELQTKVHELQTVQTARVMTPEEVKTLNHDTVVWYEHKGVHPPRPRVVHYANDHHVTFTDGCTLIFADDGYGSHWRCWTQRPTDEQREAKPWRN